MEKELTQSQIVERFGKAQEQAKNLGISVENKNGCGFEVTYANIMLNYYNSLHEVEIFLSGYKAAQMHAAMEKEGL